MLEVILSRRPLKVMKTFKGHKHKTDLEVMQRN